MVACVPLGGARAEAATARRREGAVSWPPPRATGKGLRHGRPARRQEGPVPWPPCPLRERERKREREGERWSHDVFG